MDERVPAELFLASYPDPIRDLAESLRAVVRRSLPEVAEGVRLGWRIVGFDVPNGRRTTYFAWVMPETQHVHLGFVHGILMDDPGHVLHGIARQARWVTFRPGDPVDAAVLEELVREGARVAVLSRGERVARLLDREAGPPA